ncbi:cytochrome P450 [Thozetella sp. PMI_491]|nr:cytochrome P450 [Thozetella sp. PMI_491]
MEVLLLAFGSVCAVLFSLIISWVVNSVYNAYLHPLAKVPGPRIYGFSQFPYLYHTWSGRWPQALKLLHDRYGPVVRFGPTDVSFIAPGAWQKVFAHKSQDDKVYKKDHHILRAQAKIPTIANADPENHRRMRRLLAHAFSEKALRNQEDIMKHYIDLLVTKFSLFAQQGEIVDIVRWYNYATFDLIGDLAFGRPFGCLENSKYHPWVGIIFDSVRHTTYTLLGKRVWILQPIITRLVPKKLRRNLLEHRKLSEMAAMERIQNENATRHDFLHYILRHNDEKGMSIQEIIEISNTLILAGSETTATQLSGTTFNILKNPDVYKKLVEEIRAAFASEEEITLTSVNNLDYMLATFSESFRVYPPAPIGLPRFVPEGGDTIEGYWIPANTSVSIPHYAAYRCAQNWVDPERFDPERWLGVPQYAQDKRDVFNPFSVGPRDCIGRNLAYAEMRLILARVLWNFDLELMPESENWMDQDAHLLWVKGALKVRLIPVVREEAGVAPKQFGLPNPKE